MKPWAETSEGSCQTWITEQAVFCDAQKGPNYYVLYSLLQIWKYSSFSSTAVDFFKDVWLLTWIKMNFTEYHWKHHKTADLFGS